MHSGIRQFFSSLIEIVEVILIALVAVFLVRTYLFQPFLVSGASMETNFSHGDYILIDELSYRFREPERGEVVVFRYPKDESTYFIKRIIGLPGETVEISRNHIVVYNAANPTGTVLPESYIPENVPVLSCSTSQGQFNAKLTLGADEYFVMGDNRLASFDSRCWGAIQKRHIIGLARLRLWPIDKVMAISAPAY